MKGKKASNFYNAILQNLFFGTLNQKMVERRFADERGYPANIKEYGVKNLYRYGDKFSISKVKVLELIKDIPFLNGGLFDCLDKDDESNRVIYVDGFSRNPAKQSIIPDYLFFQQEEERVDLSNYGLGASRPVRGLIEILNSYNFTIDENTPVDQEIALDPELLGKVFENLLASYNPETATTARKATGSYYTPREIVDYMVEESLFEYLKGKLSEIEEEKIRMLLSYSEEIPEFSEPERKKIISVIDDIKILDPACGSGAFPMGILHKLVYALQKLDPNNKYWHELQYQKALKESEEVFKQDDKNERQERLKEINEAFDEGINYPDYARKLYLIENCIYGVDIQPIAIQISKLRFFISLVLDQKVDRGKENLGIRALPNLETKFVAANTLIGLDKPEQLTFKNPDIEKKEEELKRIRHKYFEAKTRKEKLDYQKKDQQIRKEIADLLKDCGWDTSTAEKIAAFDLYDQNASFNWFDPEWMFGIKSPSPLAGEGSGEGGFDIVIGNPPYVRHEALGKEFKNTMKQNYPEVANGIADIYVYFFAIAFKFLKPKGVLSYITPNKYLKTKYGLELRNTLGKYQVDKIIDFFELPVFEAANDIAITILKNKPQTQTAKYYPIRSLESLDLDILTQGNYLTPQMNETEWIFTDNIQNQIIEKIYQNSISLKDFVNNRIYYGIKTGLNEVFIIDNKKKEEICQRDPKSLEIIKQYIQPTAIKKFSTIWKGDWLIFTRRGIDIEKYTAVKKYLLNFKERLEPKPNNLSGNWIGRKAGNYKWFEIQDNIAYYKEFENSKIIYIHTAKKHEFYLDNEGHYINNSCYMIVSDNKFLFCFLNSKLFEWFKCLKFVAYGDADKGGRCKLDYNKMITVPIKNISKEQQKSFITLVDQILSAKKKDSNADTSALEHQIDKMVYELYELTPEEIAIVEGRK
jgi:hypothetical protein